MRLSAKYCTNGVGLLITIGNIIFKFLALFLIKRTGSHSMSVDFYYTKIVITLVSIFNSGLLVLLMNANIPGLGIHGKYADFNSSWYRDNGKIIVMSMLINVSSPLIELAILGSIQYFTMVKD